MASTRQGYLALGHETTSGVALKPTKFVRFKEGDVNYGLEVIKNNPIQNNRWNAINAVPGKVDTSGSYKVDVDPTEIVHFLKNLLSTSMSSADISSLTDGSVYEHTIDHGCSVGSLSIEQGKGNICAPANNGQNYSIERAYGCYLDMLKMSGKDSILEGQIEVKALGLFQRAKLIKNESVEGTGKAISGATRTGGIATFTSAVHSFSVGDIVVVAGMTPSLYNGSYVVLSTPLSTTFTVAIASDPGTFSVGGTATKQSMFYFDSIEGLAVGDLVKFYESTTGTYENATITGIDLSNGILGFGSITSAIFTVANDTKVELRPQTPSYGTARVFSFTHCDFRFGSSVSNAYLQTPENVENREFEYKNNLEERYGSLRSSPSVIAPKGNEATLKYTKYFETKAEMDRYLNQTKKSCVLTITNNETVSATDTLLAKYTINIEMSDLRYTTYEMPTGTDELYAVNVEASCFYDNSDAKALRIKVKNGSAGTIYS